MNNNNNSADLKIKKLLAYRVTAVAMITEHVYRNRMNAYTSLFRRSFRPPCTVSIQNSNRGVVSHEAGGPQIPARFAPVSANLCHYRCRCEWRDMTAPSRSGAERRVYTCQSRRLHVTRSLPPRLLDLTACRPVRLPARRSARPLAPRNVPSGCTRQSRACR
ncbi:hypothetical protein DPEC_G00173400 [Dallia pectoralis]|uniref:Uncharacterized protein n=1 Tax=Dallia pectoralis TaxID=75939 RepID=A0ACC2GE87_DALPE|nr:hypothetical protein DPEC_G00173400 [Dallia pectoralis]